MSTCQFDWFFFLGIHWFYLKFLIVSIRFIVWTIVFRTEKNNETWIYSCKNFGAVELRKRKSCRLKWLLRLSSVKLLKCASMICHIWRFILVDWYIGRYLCRFIIKMPFLTDLKGASSFQNLFLYNSLIFLKFWQGMRNKLFRKNSLKMSKIFWKFWLISQIPISCRYFNQYYCIF